MSDPVWPELFFIRHGQTDWNAERRYQGQKDIPLNAVGRAQADANGRVLRDLLSRLEIDPAGLEWHASPLGRARETMERIRSAFVEPLPAVIHDERLLEISFGILEGYLYTDLPPGLAVSAGSRDADYWEYRPEGGENYVDVEARLRAYGLSLKRPAVVVSHGGIARVMRVLVERASVTEALNWSTPQDVVLHFTAGKLDVVGGPGHAVNRLD